MRIASQSDLLLNLGDDALRIRAGAVHLVDERQPRDVIAFHLAIDGDRLRLHAADGAQHEDRAVEHAQAALDFDGEIDVARRVDQVDRAVFPFDRGGGAGDGDSALAFEVHVVHGGPALAFHLLHAMDSAGVVQDSFAQGGFARVDVGRDADVAKFCNVHSYTFRPLESPRKRNRPENNDF